MRLLFDPAVLPCGEYQARGKTLQAWLDDPTAPHCGILPNTLKFAALNAWTPVNTVAQPILPHTDIVVWSEAQNMGILPGPWYYHGYTAQAPPAEDGSPLQNEWQSFIAPGVMFITLMFRYSGPHAAQVAHALYASQFPIWSLNCIYVVDIINDDTLDLLKDHIYTARNGLIWPPTPLATRVCTYGSAEYEALLGSEIGSVVSYILLGAYPRGTRRVSRISVEFPLQSCLSLRFEFENIPGNAGAPPPYTVAPAVTGKRGRKGSESDPDYESEESDESDEPPRKRRGNVQPHKEPYTGPATRTRQRTRAGASQGNKAPRRGP